MACQVMDFLSQFTIRSRYGARPGLRAISPSTIASGMVWTSSFSFIAAKSSLTAAVLAGERGTAVGAVLVVGAGFGAGGRVWPRAAAARHRAYRAGAIRRERFIGFLSVRRIRRLRSASRNPGRARTYLH